MVRIVPTIIFKSPTALRVGFQKRGSKKTIAINGNTSDAMNVDNTLGFQIGIGLGAGPAAAVPGILLGSKQAGAGSDQPDAPATQQQLMTQTYTLQEEIPSIKEKRDQLGRDNLLSAGFMTRQKNQLEGEKNAGQ